jgi:O-antigen/teichoic acid export membrane protein
MAQAATAVAEQTPDTATRFRDDDRLDPSVVSLRRHTARGTLINSAFNIGLYGVGTLQRFLVAIWLTRSQYGIWGILLAALMALMWIKQFGVGDKYIQQSEPDQERAFQKAFTLELALSGAFFAIACVALPIYALAYGRPEIILPGIVLGIAVPLTSLESPTWIAYRRMDYARQRLLSSVDPVVSLAATITLTAMGLGYWGLVLGAVAGSLVGATVCVVTCPYKLRLRLDWGTVKSYASFSLPLVGFGLCSFVTLQGTLLVANRAVGLAGIGVIGLASNVVGLSDGVDGIVSQTLYPAVCAVAHRTEVLAETFVKSNRAALMWGMAAMVGVALFSSDIVHFIFGPRWHAAAPIIAALALSCGLAQVAFNWTLFLRAVNQTRPIFIVALAEVVVFLAVSVPATLLLGLKGYAIGFATVTASQVVLRSYYMRKLFGSFSALRQLVHGVLPTLPAVTLVLGIRLLAGDHTSLARALAEAALYVITVVGGVYLFERPLVLELLGYMRKVRAQGAQAALATG